ncbi:MAG: IS66 family insertion sequence element accessory protein TnpB [Bdellovibrionaceae bacterium]|nr:IS66 family insertion sequence element accessory protein TnpB [Pseudobdellovibrionaceae bacterium]
MITFNRRTRVFVCKEPTDMRASYDSLFARTKDILRQDPFSGHLFVFMNARRTAVKCLYYDGTGFVLLCKRLERGTFSALNPYYRGEIALTAAEFSLFFEGASFDKRFIDSPLEVRKSFPMSQELQSAQV